jgi:hypothetical protein
MQNYKRESLSYAVFTLQKALPMYRYFLPLAYSLNLKQAATKLNGFTSPAINKLHDQPSSG